MMLYSGVGTMNKYMLSCTSEPYGPGQAAKLGMAVADYACLANSPGENAQQHEPNQCLHLCPIYICAITGMADKLAKPKICVTTCCYCVHITMPYIVFKFSANRIAMTLMSGFFHIELCNKC